MYKPKQVFKQGDSKWSKILLGFNTSKYTIGSDGCLITCLSMIQNITPDSMNTKLKDIEGFANGGYYIWGSFTKLFKTPEKLTMTPSKLTTTQIKEIQTALDKGYPVMCGIDFIPTTAKYDMHFVLFTDYNGEDFTIADPWTGTIRSLKDYLYGTKKTARDTIEQYIIYEVEVAEDELQVMEDSRDFWKKQSSIFETKVSKLLDTIDKMEKEAVVQGKILNDLRAYLASTKTVISQFTASEIVSELLGRLVDGVITLFKKKTKVGDNE